MPQPLFTCGRMLTDVAAILRLGAVHPTELSMISSGRQQEKWHLRNSPTLWCFTDANVEVIVSLLDTALPRSQTVRTDD